MKLHYVRYPRKPESERTQTEPSGNPYVATGFNARLMRPVVHYSAFGSELILCPSAFQMN
ncbi:MAG TPA: hypothetical protein VJY15_25050 [Candidatus Acidoferrum sp.]|nr:hypothetical protein [Candidatus Acidoferrum sp.]